MFYGNFKGDNAKNFRNCLATYKNIFKKIHASDNLITFNRNQTYLDDPVFVEAFNLSVSNKQEASLGWRLHILCWAAKQVSQTGGDFVECGVYKGFSMSVIAKYINFGTLDKNMYLYDSFAGIPEEYNSENRSNRVYNQSPNMFEEVVEKFKSYQNIHVIKGIIPDSFAIKCPTKIAFLHIDLNSSKSEIAALDSLFDLVIPGGIIIFDDFGWYGYHAQTKAEIEWLASKNQSILELPTGQGMVIKKI